MNTIPANNIIVTHKSFGAEQFRVLFSTNEGQHVQVESLLDGASRTMKVIDLTPVVGPAPKREFNIDHYARAEILWAGIFGEAFRAVSHFDNGPGAFLDFGAAFSQAVNEHGEDVTCGQVHRAYLRAALARHSDF
jgi:hypothetical protein